MTTDLMTRPMRSWMFVPGDKPRFLEKCRTLPVDGVLLDLEDGVAVSMKPVAREQVARAVKEANFEPIAFVRVNSYGSPWFDDDLAMIVQPGLAGILLPKVEDVDDVRAVSAQLDRLEQAAGMEVGQTKLMLAIESAKGLLRAAELAAAGARIFGLILGAEDLALDLGLSVLREDEARELLFARSTVVTAARSAGVASIDGVYPDFADIDGLRVDGGQARRLGFTGKSLFHPGQIDEVNAIFSPSDQEISYAKEVVAAFEEATRRGDGAVAVNGQLVDLPIVRRAQRLIDVVGGGASR